MTKSKICRKCGENKPLDDFYRNKMGADGRQSWCKSCHRTRWGDYGSDDAVKERRYEAQAQRKFDVRLGELKSIRDAQHGKCLGCFADGKLQVDHDHASGRVRGLLCGNCNKILGLAHDESATLLNLWAYLEGLTQVTVERVDDS